MKKIQHPTGYPYMLFKTRTKGHNIGYTTALSEEVVRLSHNVVKVEPIYISKLIEDNGHAEVHKFLKVFGDTWICKEGHVFFRNANE